MCNGLSTEEGLQDLSDWAAATSARQRIKSADEVRQSNNPKRHLLVLKHLNQALADLGPKKTELLAETLRQLCFAHHEAARRSRRNRKKHQEQALHAYERAIGVWHELGKTILVAGNLTNLSALYAQYGHPKCALRRARAGLELERWRHELDAESVGAWTHAAACHLALGQIDEAEKVVLDGIKMFKNDKQSSSFLFEVMANVYEHRARQYRERALATRPTSACRVVS